MPQLSSLKENCALEQTTPKLLIKFGEKNSRQKTAPKIACVHSFTGLNSEVRTQIIVTSQIYQVVPHYHKTPTRSSLCFFLMDVSDVSLLFLKKEPFSIHKVTEGRRAGQLIAN